MKECLADFVFDSVNQEIRTRSRREIFRPIFLISGSLFVILFLLLSVFNVSPIFSFLGLIPIATLLIPMKKRVLASKYGNKVLFATESEAVELDPVGNLHCRVVRSCGDAFDTFIIYKHLGCNTPLLESPDYVTEDTFKNLFEKFFGELTYEYIEK